MQKNYYAIILLVSTSTVSYAMDKKVNYIVYQKLNHGAPVTKIDFFIPCKEPDKPEIVIKTIYLDENQTKAFIMPLVREAKETQAWRAWTTKWNAARL